MGAPGEGFQFKPRQLARRVIQRLVIGDRPGAVRVVAVGGGGALAAGTANPLQRQVDAALHRNRPAGDDLFNFDVFQATHALYDQQKAWTKEQTADYCKKATDTAKTLDMGLAP